MHHTPFHLRSRETMYIGPERPRARNFLGIIGFVVSLLSLLFTFGVLSPLGLLISSLAMLKRPRGFATAGVVLGLLPTVIWGLIVIGTISGVQHERHVARLERQKAVTQVEMEQILNDIEAFRQEHGRLPSGIEGNKLAVVRQDAWKQALRYEIYNDLIAVRSSGPDGQFENRDDIVRKRSVGREAIAEIETHAIAYSVSLGSN